MRVGVIDYGVGNLGSVVRALEFLRVRASLIERPHDLHGNDALILPGVGNFDDCARLLQAEGWIEAICEQVVAYNRSLLGICLGMQLLATTSTEGAHDGTSELPRGLDLIPGRVLNIKSLGCSLRVPHVGWNSVNPQHSDDGLFDKIPSGTDFYFVHSYAFVPDDIASIAGTMDYGVGLTAAIRRGRVVGTQFHPEKSSRAGFTLLRNFLYNI